MIRKQNPNQEYLEDFDTQFGGKLPRKNKWVAYAEELPWDVIEDVYATGFSADRGVYAINGRIAFGALFIQTVTKLPDRDVVEYISENPFAQYFLGLKEFRYEPLFDPSMMVHFRKRFTPDFINRLNRMVFEPKAMEDIVTKVLNERKDKDGGDPPRAAGGKDGGDPPRAAGGRDGGDQTEDWNAGNTGILMIDATCSPADIRYPNDISLLNEAREDMERIIEELWPYGNRTGHKTGYMRKRARNGYLSIAKQRKPGYRRVRQAIGRQLEYLRKAIEAVGRLLMQTGTDALPEKRLKRIRTVCELHRQQENMHRRRVQTCENRIVSLRQPHIRPMVRGKSGRPYEFGQKIAASVVGGYTFLERQSYDGFNEGVLLKESVERYRERYGCYPEAVLADRIYRNRENLRYCKEHAIRLSGPRLGRPKRALTAEEKRQGVEDNKGNIA